MLRFLESTPARPSSPVARLRVLLLVSALGQAAPVSAERLPVELVIEPPSLTQVTYAISPFGTDSETIVYTGTLTGEVEIDGETGTISGLMIQPSRVFASDFTLRVPLDPDYYVGLQGAGISSEFSSNGMILPVSENGEVDQNELTQTIDRGTLTTSSNLPGTSPEVVDFEVAPEPFPEGGPVQITAHLESVDPIARRWLIRLVRPIDETVSVTEDGVTIVTTEVGSIFANGRIESLLPYGTWLKDAALPELPFSAPNPSNGIANGILFALDLPAESGTQLPLQRDPLVLGGWILTLPSSGLAAPLLIEKSPTLKVDSWIPLAPTEISSHGALLPKGSTGEIRFSIHNPEGRQFFRLSTSWP